MTEDFVVRISGHIPTERRMSLKLSPTEHRSWTVGFISSRGQDRIGGCAVAREKRSMPMESRKSIFSLNGEAESDAEGSVSSVSVRGSNLVGFLGRETCVAQRRLRLW